MIENYKQKYEKALEIAKSELESCGSLDCDAAKQIFRLFPELKKSEDERIRKNAIHIICNSMNGVSVSLPLSIYKECISWLEKQD